MVDVVQWLEHRIVIPGVVGSNPIIHPSRRRFQIESASFFVYTIRVISFSYENRTTED